ncbi:hypothetical protein [Streptomyces sp. NPDC051554]|uniref:hypothetical protein n=1 Tax=Streptomyces sp. NPDC051554 TaxID=3365656 RepID=UPI0037A654BD
MDQLLLGEPVAPVPDGDQLGRQVVAEVLALLHYQLRQHRHDLFEGICGVFWGAGRVHDSLDETRDRGPHPLRHAERVAGHPHGQWMRELRPQIDHLARRDFLHRVE